MELLIPTGNFAQVRDNLFRSAQPEHVYEFAWLRNKVGIDNLVSFRAESDLDVQRGARFGFNLHKIPIVDDAPFTIAQADEFLAFLRANADKKTLFHCAHGHGRTSQGNVLARLDEGWTFDKAIAEEQAFGYTFKHPGQKEFLQQYTQLRYPNAIQKVA